MDRKIVYTGEVPLGDDFLNSEKNTMIAIGMALKAILGTATIIDGLACTPTGPASMQVQVGPGSIHALENLDSTTYGDINADTTHQLVKQGLSLDNTLLGCPAPSTTGNSINYLIQVAIRRRRHRSGGAAVFRCRKSFGRLRRPCQYRRFPEHNSQGRMRYQREGRTFQPRPARRRRQLQMPDSWASGSWLCRMARPPSHPAISPCIPVRRSSITSCRSWLLQARVHRRAQRRRYRLMRPLPRQRWPIRLMKWSPRRRSAARISRSRISQDGKSGNHRRRRHGYRRCPASGFVSVYAIAKSDGTQSILACNASTSSGSVYSGSNMPSGYTYSALLGTWPTNGSSQFVVGTQIDRKFYMPSAVALNTSSRRRRPRHRSHFQPSSPRTLGACEASAGRTIPMRVYRILPEMQRRPARRCCASTQSEMSLRKSSITSMPRCHSKCRLSRPKPSTTRRSFRHTSPRYASKSLATTSGSKHADKSQRRPLRYRGRCAPARQLRGYADPHSKGCRGDTRPACAQAASIGLRFEDKTIALGDSIKGMKPGSVTLYCAQSTCHNLMLDLDDAMQLGGWDADFEQRQVESENEKGIFVGPPGQDAGEHDCRARQDRHRRHHRRHL